MNSLPRYACVVRFGGAALMLVLFGPVPAGADVYKWTDERGQVHYSEKAPAGRSAKSLGIDTAPAPSARGQGTVQCQTIQCQYDRLRKDRAADAEDSRAERRANAQRAAAQPRARGMSFDVFARLDRGMSEAEVAERAGPPDYEGFDGARGAKTWTYFPTESDPFTTSVILRGGRVFEIDRRRRL